MATSRKRNASKAAYCKRRKQKIMRKLKQIHDSKRSDCKAGKTSILLARCNAEMSSLMDSSI